MRDCALLVHSEILFHSGGLSPRNYIYIIYIIFPCNILIYIFIDWRMRFREERNLIIRRLIMRLENEV